MAASAVPILAIGVTETWFRSYTTDAAVRVDGFNLFRADRSNRIGGGCALYIHGSLAVTDQLTYSDKNNSLVAVFVKQINTVFASTYRAPGDTPVSEFKSMMRDFQSFIEKISVNSVPDIYYIGDFNLPLFKWVDGSSVPIDQPFYNEIQEFMDYNGAVQMIDKPTRCNNILDLVFTNRPSRPG